MRNDNFVCNDVCVLVDCDGEWRFHNQIAFGRVNSYAQVTLPYKMHAMCRASQCNGDKYDRRRCVCDDQPKTNTNVVNLVCTNMDVRYGFGARHDMC